MGRNTSSLYVSAANNLGWVLSGHDLAGVFSTFGVLLGHGVFLRGYEFFLAAFLPSCREAYHKRRVSWPTLKIGGPGPSVNAAEGVRFTEMVLNSTKILWMGLDALIVRQQLWSVTSTKDK